MYSVTEAQAKLPQVLREMDVDVPVAITRHDKTIAYIVSREQMESILETMELMANPEAVQAIRDDRAGKLKFRPMEEVFAELDALEAQEARE